MRRAPAFVAWFLLAALAAGAAQAQLILEDRTRQKKSDWEEQQEKLDWKESDIKLPAFPKNEGLIEFYVAAVQSFRFFIDPASVAPGPDGVVRYTLVARSPAGYANVSYEGIRCATNAYRVYATGGDGRWSRQDSAWREIEPRSVQRWHLELRTNYFCPVRVPIFSAAEGVDALRRGGHPSVYQRSGAGRR